MPASFGCNQTKTNTELTTTSSLIEGEILSCDDDIDIWSSPKGHTFPIAIIQYAIELFSSGKISMRGAELSIELFAKIFKIPVPNYSSIRNWCYRMGMYLLNSQPERRDDWVWIIDVCVELGVKKCLLVLGVPQDYIENNGLYSLNHTDVKVLTLEVMEHCTGEEVNSILKGLEAQIGTPFQVISDHGGDIKKGIEILCTDNGITIYTYDITHKCGCLIKSFLNNDSAYAAFCQICSETFQRIKQTELNHLHPPNQRTKARWLNVDILSDWALWILKYYDEGDFRNINQNYIIDAKTITPLFKLIDSDTMNVLYGMISHYEYGNESDLITVLKEHIGIEATEKYYNIISLHADLGRRKFLEYFAWLDNYRSEIDEFAELIDVVREVQKEIKGNGVSKKTPLILEKGYVIQSESSISSVKEMQILLIEHIKNETKDIPNGKTLLSTSDVIESLFGKYKLFTTRCPLKELGKLILTTLLSTTKLSHSLILEAMESVRMKDVEAWSLATLGKSDFSKRRDIIQRLKCT